METPRKKLGTNLGPAPAIGAFAPPTLRLQGAVIGAGHSSADEALPAGEPSIAPSAQVASPFPGARPGNADEEAFSATALKPATATRREPAAPLPQGVAGFKRVHGTYADPYQRKTDGAQTRQTTLTLDIELDDRFENFFRKNRRTFRTRSSLWAAAMAQFLERQGQ